MRDCFCFIYFTIFFYFINFEYIFKCVPYFENNDTINFDKLKFLISSVILEIKTKVEIFYIYVEKKLKNLSSTCCP